MRAIVIDRFGPPEVLHEVELPLPRLSAGEVLVRVEAAGINPIDWLTRSGRGVGVDGFPAVLGWDVSGVVVRNEPPGQEFEVGDEVFALARFPSAAGCYAEYVGVPAEQLVRKPAGASHVEAAASAMVATTASQALFDHGGLEAGQRVLIHSGAGGVGHVAVQLAKAAGAEVVASASARNRRFLLGLGADRVVPYDSEWGGAGTGHFDVVIDPRGGDDFKALLRAVGPGGTIVGLKGRRPEYDAAASAAGVRAAYEKVEPDASTLAKVADSIESGTLRPVVERTFALSGARDAHTLGEEGHVRGKLILEVS